MGVAAVRLGQKLKVAVAVLRRRRKAELRVRKTAAKIMSAAVMVAAVTAAVQKRAAKW